MELKVAAAYVRVSTEDQVEYSPDSQLKLIRDYAKREGYIIPDEYIFRDEGISGKSADKRPAFRLMIATAKEDNRPFDAIFVWKYSRFARNQEEAIMYKNLLRKKGVDVKSISEPSNDSPFSSLIERIIEWMDEYYLINLAEEVRRGMREKASRGEPIGKAPFGYKTVDKVLVQTDDAATVQDIFEWYVSGKSCRQIAAELNTAGVRRPNGELFNNMFISYLLKNPVYVGKIRCAEKGRKTYREADYKADLSELANGKHEAIIPLELWEMAQKRLLSRAPEVKYQRDTSFVFMLKGLIRCSDCGATLVPNSSKKHTDQMRLQCYRYNSGKCQKSHFIMAKRANEAVIDCLEQCISSNTFLFAPQKPKERKKEADWGKLISSEESRLKRAKTAFLDGLFSESEYREIKASVEDNIGKLKTAQEREITTSDSQIDFKPKAIEVLSIIKSPDVSEEAKNIALRSIIDKIVYDKEQNTFDVYFVQ